MKLSIRELRDHLSNYLLRARAGDEIVVTSETPRRPAPILKKPEPDTVTRLQSQPWLRSGNGQPVLGSDCPARVPEGTVSTLIKWVRGE